MMCLLAPLEEQITLKIPDSKAATHRGVTMHPRFLVFKAHLENRTFSSRAAFLLCGIDRALVRAA
jgi:hypothetical protein